MDREIISQLPKIELHCHLDGSLGLELTQRLLAQRGEKYDQQTLRELLQAPQDCESLHEYLQRFDLPNEVLQTEAELEAAAFDLAERAAAEQVRYLEVRFAPTFSTAEGLSVQAVLAAVWNGLVRARQQYGIESGIIVCGMRGLSERTNLRMLREARELYGAGVVACDLAGDEKSYPMEEFVYFFTEAKKLGIPFTIHAGECGSRENIRGSIEIGASRIGHGIAMMRDRTLQKLCVDHHVAVELCPTSNLQTKAILDFAGYPIREFMDAGVAVSINTDNRTVSQTDMTQEITRVAEVFHLTKEEYCKIYRDSVEYIFADDDVKQRLWKEKF